MANPISKLHYISEFAINSDFIVNRFSVNLFDRSQLLTKRIFDLMVAGLFLILIGSWLFAVIAILIKLDSKGPVFYRQSRHGRNNVPFTCLKFRSMQYNPNGHFKQASKGDPRITKVGELLRKTSLDELPQLFNVIMGHMSLVGPRPHAMVMNRDYSEKIELFMYRHMVKPGITGLAQAKGFRGEIQSDADINSRLRYDLFYIKNWRLSFDLAIMYWTLHSMVFNNDKAY